MEEELKRLREEEQEKGRQLLARMEEERKKKAEEDRREMEEKLKQIEQEREVCSWLYTGVWSLH